MRRVEIQIRRRDGPEHRIVLNRFASLAATIALAVLAIAVLVLAVAFGYLVIGFALTGLLIAIILVILRITWTSIRR
jgi:small-conductance mechanosensitive channel